MSTDCIKILFTGDFCPINRVEQLAIKNDLSSVFNDFIDVFSGNDLNIVNLECPLTFSDRRRRKIGPHQKANPGAIKLLNFAGINLVTLANNHIMDFGSEGVADTLELCKKNNIETIGIGKTPDEAATPFSFVIREKRVAILNYADNEFIISPDGEFTCNPIDITRFYYDIKRSKESHDFVVVIVHAGNEFYELPSLRTKYLYRYIIDLGADALLSHHTHAFSGYEVYKSKPVFYGLGNFLYDWPGRTNSRWNKGYAVRLMITDGISFEILPFKQNNELPGIFHMNEKETLAFNDEMERLNLIIADDNRLEAEFKNYCTSVNPMYDAFVEPYFGRFIASLRKRGLFPRLMTRRKRLLLLNLLRCDSHRDVLIRMLKQNE